MLSSRFVISLVLLLGLPACLWAVDMGGMGGMVNKIEIQTKTVGKVVFTHSLHGTHCNACHPKIFVKKNNSNHVSMKAMERGKSCGACHNGKRAFTVKANCTKCHAGDIRYRNAEVGDVVFPHSTHIEMYGCDECHPALFVARQGANRERLTMEAMEGGESCGACHDGSTAFGVADACDSCHQM